MKILYLITKSEAGGAQTHVADLCNYFKNKNHEIVVMSSGNGWLKKECDNMGISFKENIFFSNKANPITIYRSINEIRKFVNLFRPDIVHCHSSAAGILGRLAIKGSVKTVYTAHGWGFNVGVRFWIKYPILFLEKICAPYTNVYICVADFVKQLGLKYKLGFEDKFNVVYNGVSSNQNLERKKSDYSEFIFVGRLAEPKRPELVIEAINTLPREIKNKINFTIVGDGPKRKILEKLALDMSVRVNFVGALSRKESMVYLSKSDIFIFISSWEGFPYSILEAMSFGLPVISSNVGGIAEVVDMENGILIDNEIGQIRDAILKLVSNRDFGLRLGYKGKQKVEEKFSLKKMLTKIEDIYNGL